VKKLGRFVINFAAQSVCRINPMNNIAVDVPAEFILDAPGLGGHPLSERQCQRPSRRFTDQFAGAAHRAKAPQPGVAGRAQIDSAMRGQRARSDN
ncbi:MAG: hypothetical protein WBM87_10405, partial [Woeseiaceae bacterium]